VKIAVADIKEKPRELAAEELVGEYPALEAMEASGECRFLEPIRIALAVVKEYDHIRVHGEVKTAALFSCSRCLVEYASSVTSTFTIFYTRSQGKEILDEEVELAEEDLVSTTYTGDEIDFTPVIAEQIILGLPVKPLCKESCLGLCSNCGADLNVSPCECEPVDGNLSFSALRNLKIEK
jgi:uncharacterized protein